MKSTLLTSFALIASCALSQAAVTFSSIAQTVDGNTPPSTSLQNLTGTSGSTQTVTGDAVGESIAYATLSFTLDVVAAAGDPTPGDASATLQFTVDANTPYTAPSGFFGTTEGAMGTSGTLQVGSTYIMTTSITGGAVTPTSSTLGLTLVPEPSTALLGLLGFAGLLRRRR